MTVKQLINILEDFGEDTKVYIGMRQSFGSDFVYSIDGFEEEVRINTFYGNDLKRVICIMEGDQIGTMSSDDDDDEEEDE